MIGSIVLYLTWPILIAVSYFVVVRVLKAIKEY